VVISEELRERLDDARSRYPETRGALLPALHLVQEAHGHVGPDATRELAEYFDLRPIDVLSVIRFYNMIYTTPQPRHHVFVCTNLSCSLRGSRTLLAGLEAHLGIRRGEATDDARVALGTEECLGACAGGPMLRVDGEYVEDIDLENAIHILDELE
jgi:NADH-quinone oxidoreductase subunit E